MTSPPGSGVSSRQPAAATLLLEGHLIDSLLLAKVLDEILAGGADYEVTEVTIGRGPADQSRAVLSLSHADPEALDTLCTRLAAHGARRVPGPSGTPAPGAPRPGG